ncbi:MAG: hypothetical protein JWQ13_649 [Ramlibacter sp.]|jgi:hypothetical protein|nr:hypothetical protein [Ramlibacter sp.]
MDPWLSFHAPTFIYVKIPVPGGIESEDRSLDEAIDRALAAGALGSVLGWGSSLGERTADGSRPVAFHRIDVQVDDLDAGRAALHGLLPGLGVPVATELHYVVDDRHLVDVYEGPGWRFSQAA